MKPTLADADAVGLSAASVLLVHHPGKGGVGGLERVDEGPKALDELAQLAAPIGALIPSVHSLYSIHYYT